MTNRSRSELPVVDHLMWIDGAPVESSSGKWRESVDPFTGKVWARVTEGNSQDVDRAVKSAQTAFHEGPWSKMTGRDRRRLLLELARLLRRDAERIAEIESRDNGKLFKESLGMVEVSAEWYEYFAGWADKIQGDVIPLDATSIHVHTVREPIGVIAAITAWNSPILMAAYKLGPGLATGCTFVLKPAEVTSLSTLAFVELTREAGFPPGVVNVITGDGINVGGPLVSHPGVNKIAFTGSSATGSKIAQAAAEHLAPVMLELGGKSPQIVFDDANLDAAEMGIVSGIFAAAGQSCVAGSRLLVHQDIAEELTQRIITRASKLILGDPLNEATELGPISFEKHMERVIEIIRRSESEGTKLAYGGIRALREDLSSGFFIEPTILIDPNQGSEIFKEEVFGPVLCISTFKDEAEAIKIANSTRYGLAAGIWTQNVGRALRVARGVEAGTVWVNTYRRVNFAVPFGGVKSSGYGRENGADSIHEFTKTKAVWIETAPES